MNKTISKAKLDAAIEATRYIFNSDVPFEEKDVHVFMEATQNAYGGKYSITMNDFLSSIFAFGGFNREASNEDIYKVLEVLGWTVE